MKTKIKISKPLAFLAGMCMAGWGLVPRASAQASANLNIQIYAGLTVTGQVGTVYSIEYTSDLTPTRAVEWRCLAFYKLPAPSSLWVDTSAPVAARRFYRAVPFGQPTNMVFIPPGTFRMGSPTNEVDRGPEEGPQTEVTISRGFWIGKYKVTQQEYLSLMGSPGSFFYGDQTGNPNVSAELARDYGIDLTRPVDSPEWADAVEYCRRLTERERMAGRIPAQCAFRLPTEAEWEYACRGWNSTRFSFGDDPGYTNLTDYAWYEVNSDLMTHPVDQKRPNPWGLHDMHGNVSEWCSDWYGFYPGGTATDPQGPPVETSWWGHVIRGGNWLFAATSCRSAARWHWGPELGEFLGLHGFRVVLAPTPP